MPAYDVKPSTTSIIDSKPSVTQAFEGNPQTPAGSGSGYRDMIRLGMGEDSVPSEGTGPAPTDNTHYISFASASSECAYIDDNATVDLAGDFTISFWAKFRGTASAGTDYILTKHTASAGERGYQIFYNLDASPDRLTIEIYQDDTTASAAYWGINISTLRNFWNLYTFTCDASNGLTTKFKLYINGVDQGNGTTSGGNATSINNNTQPLVIGAQTSAGANAIDIDVDSLKIYNALKDIDDVFIKSTSEDVDVGLQGFWTFDNVYTDLSGNGLTLTAVNTPTFATDVLFSVYGDLYKYYPSFDGYVGNGVDVANRSTVWTTVHGAASGDAVVADNLTGNDARASVERGQAGANTWVVYRTFFTFDTSDLLITDYIVGGFLWLNASAAPDVDETFSLALVNPTPASETTLVAGDFDQCGDVNSPTEGASQFSVTGVSVFGVWFNLDSTGLSWLNRTGTTLLGVRDSHDLSTTTPPHTGTDRTVFDLSTVDHATEYRRPWLGIIKN